MIEVPGILKNAAEKSGLERARYADKATPTSMSDVCVLPFFGDLRSTVILSSLLLKRYREECKGSKYFILASWPGMGGLFPYVDEYWQVSPGTGKSMYPKAAGMANGESVNIHRNLNYFFEDVIDTKELLSFYDNGFKKDFLDRFRNIKRFLPGVPSAAVLGQGYIREIGKKQGNRVFLMPTTFAYTWRLGKYESVRVPQEFWERLVATLLDQGYVPILWNNFLSYDLSPVFTDRCIYITETDTLSVIGAMRGTVVLDVFNGLSRLAILARTPFVSCDERQRYSGTKEWEFDDLCAELIPREYIFSFATILVGGDKTVWKLNLFDGILHKLNSVFEDVDFDQLPSTGETFEIVPYQKVREVKAKKFGTQFVKIPRI
jgi:hypothetical protein